MKKILKKSYVWLVSLIGILLIFTGCPWLDDLSEDPPTPAFTLGDVIWTHDMQGRDSFLSTTAVALDESRGQIYYGKGGGTIFWTAARLVAVNLEDGHQIWESPPLDNNTLNSDIVIGDDGTLYVIGAHRLYAINPLNGQLDWIWEVPKQVPNPNGNGFVYSYGQIGGLALASDGGLLLSSGFAGGSYFRAVFYIDSAGQQRWANTTAVYGERAHRVVVGKENRCFFFSTPYTAEQPGLHLIALDVATGVKLWQTKIGTMGSSNNNIVFDNEGNLVISVPLTYGDPYRLYKVSPENGAVLGSSTQEASDRTKLIGADGKIYQRKTNSGLYTYDASDLTATVFPEGINVALEGALINSKNQLALIHNQGSVSSINVYSPTGMLDWSSPLEGMDSRKLLLSNKGIYYGILKNKGLFAIQGEFSLANSNWPKPGHDNQNTFNMTR